MTRLWLIALLALALLAAPLAAEAQPAVRTARIGILSPAFEELGVGDRLPPSLTGRGWVEGANLRIESRTALGGDAQLDQLAAELAGLPVDVIVTSGMLATRAAKRATTTVPIIFAVEGDPVGEGLVTSMARPGGNLTGLTIQSPDLARKRLQLLTEVTPRPGCVGVLVNPENRDKDAEWQAVQAAAERLGIKVRVLAVRAREDVAPAVEAAKRNACGGLLVLSDRIIWGEAVGIAALARQHRLPVMYPDRYYPDPIWGGGGLMSYGANQLDLSLDLAAYVDRVLKGARPSSLPVLTPSRFEFVVNLKTAKALGLTIPPSVLARADQVIE
jgi:putative ABC transport system substrate-binding protein